jgi:hypothetical protein
MKRQSKTHSSNTDTAETLVNIQLYRSVMGDMIRGTLSTLTLATPMIN